MIQLLLVEDDASIHQLLVDTLTSQSLYSITSAYSGTEAWLQLQHQTFDCILLDLMLPGMTGEQLLENIQSIHQGGCIVLSAKSDLEDKVHLLQLGADDYLTKPFHPQELLARLESVLRRYGKHRPQSTPTTLTFQQLTLNLEEMTATFNDQALHLTTTEFELLKHLMQEPRKVFTREKLYQRIWGEDAFIEDNAINVHISNIRKKIAQHTADTYIETVWGIGFKLKAND